MAMQNGSALAALSFGVTGVGNVHCMAMALGGEWLDIVNETRNSALQPDAAHWHDIRNTIFWPTVLALVGRWFPRGERIAAAAETPQRSGDHAERGLEQT